LLDSTRHINGPYNWDLFPISPDQWNLKILSPIETSHIQIVMIYSYKHATWMLILPQNSKSTWKLGEPKIVRLETTINFTTET